MVKEPDKDFFMLPGGRIEEGETEEETLQRELKEELGVALVKGGKYAIYDLPGKAEGRMINFTVFTGELLGKIKVAKDHLVGWVDSKYESKGIKVGSITSLKLFPELRKLNLID